MLLALPVIEGIALGIGDNPLLVKRQAAGDEIGTILGDFDFRVRRFTLCHGKLLSLQVTRPVLLKLSTLNPHLSTFNQPRWTGPVNPNLLANLESLRSRLAWRLSAESRTTQSPKDLRRSTDTPLRDLAGNYRIFIKSVNRAQPMVAVGNDHLAIGRIPHQQERRHFAPGLDFNHVLFDMGIAGA